MSSSPSPPARDPPAPAPMETPAPEEPQTLAAGELVWARAKGRQSWWPARLREACPVARSSSRADALVSCFGDGEGGPLHATQVRRFADPAADGMARANKSRAFYTAVEEARACAVALLCRDLSCACPRASPPGAPEPETEGSVGVANLAPSEFLASLRCAAALDVSSVGFVDRALLDSWVRAVARLGWGPAGAGQHPRRSVDQLVDKIDLDVPAGDDRDAADWVAGDDGHLEEPQETPARKRRTSTSYKRRTATARNRHSAIATALKKGRSATATVVNKRSSATALFEEMDAADEDDQSGGTGTGLSEKRKREKRKSKYLMPPYTDVTQPYADEKWPDLPKELLIDAPKDEKKVSLENVGAPEVLLLVRCFGENISHKNRFPKAAKGFLELFRSSVFSDPEIVAGIVSDSCGAQKLGSCGMKRSRKKEKDESVGSSTKRKIEKISPTSSIDCGVPITFATPIRQVRAEDMRSPLKAEGASRGVGDGVPDEKKRLVDMSPILAAMSGPIKPERDQDQANGGSVLKTPVGARDALCDQSAKNADEAVVEATKSETDIEIDINLQSVASKEQVGPPDMNRLMDKRRVIAAMFGTIQPEREPDQANGVSAVKPPLSAALSDQSANNADEAVVEATKSDTDIEIDINLQSVSVNEQVGAPDMNRQRRVVAALFGTIQPEREPDQANNGSAVKPPLSAALSDQSANKNDEGMMEVTKSETDIQVDTNLQSAVVDLPVSSIQLEATKPEIDIQVDVNVPSVIVDVPVGTVRTEALELDHNIHVGTDELNEQNVAPDVPVGSGSLRDIPQPADVDKDKASVQVCTVQESYASLEAMVPEMLKKVEGVTTGTSVIATNHAVKNDGQNSEQPNEEKSTDGAIANNSVKAANGSCPDLTNSTHKKKAKKAPQRFEHPAEIVLTFIDGFVLPTKERLLAEFRRFGFVIESETRFFKDSGGRCARVVFGKSAEAESAYNKQWTLGMFGPPYAKVRLNYINPITLSNPPAASKPPLVDIRKNLENMISSLTDNSPVKKATSSAGPKPVYLLGEMQRLLAKVNEMLPGPSASNPP